MFWNGLTSDMHPVWRTNCERLCDSTCGPAVHVAYLHMLDWMWQETARPGCAAGSAYECCCVMSRHQVPLQMQVLPEDVDQQQKHAGRAMWMLTWHVHGWRYCWQLTSPYFWDVYPRQGLKCPYLGHWTQTSTIPLRKRKKSHNLIL
jgi:hypothetical protein